MFRNCPRHLVNHQETESIPFNFFKCLEFIIECHDQPKEDCSFTLTQKLLDRGELSWAGALETSRLTFSRNYRVSLIERTFEEINKKDVQIQVFDPSGDHKGKLSSRALTSFKPLSFPVLQERQYHMRASSLNESCDIARIFANIHIPLVAKTTPAAEAGTFKHRVWNDLYDRDFTEMLCYTDIGEYTVSGHFDGIGISEDHSTLAIIDLKSSPKKTQKDQGLIYGLGACQTLDLQPDRILTVIERPPFTPINYKNPNPNYRNLVYDICSFEQPFDNEYVKKLQNNITKSINLQQVIVDMPVEYVVQRQKRKDLSNNNKQDGCTTKGTNKNFNCFSLSECDMYYNYHSYDRATLKEFLNEHGGKYSPNYTLLN